MTFLYIDVSHYDWDRFGGNLDWQQIKDHGIDLVFIRATYGDPDTYNPETRHFVDMALGAQNAGIDVGGYHNLIHGDIDSIQRQVNYFYDTLNSVNAKYAMLDVEPYDALVKNGLWPRLTDVVTFVQDFDVIDNHRKLAIYLPQWVWASRLNKADLAPVIGDHVLVASNYPLGTMKADYKELYALTHNEGWAAYGGITPEIWQYSSNAVVPGASSTTDVNAFKGDYPSLQSRLTKDGAMAWVLTKNLQAFRDQLNAIAPNRDKTSDGSIGDAAHQAEVSGHNPDETANSECKDSDSKNEVRAIDTDVDLKVPGLTMEMIVQHLLKLARAGKLSVIRYIIYNKRIWSASSGWVQKSYTGSNPHDKHMHLSGACNQTADEAANFNYHLDELVDTLPTVDEVVNGLTANLKNQNSEYSKAMRAITWQYSGGGLPEGFSALNTLNSLYTLVAALGTQIAAESTNPAELQAALDALPTAAENADAVVSALGGSDVNVVADTLKSVLTPAQIEALKAVL